MKRLLILSALFITLMLGATPVMLSAAPPTPKRITFGAGQTSVMVSGILPPNGSDAWVLRVQGGQTMSVNLGMWNGMARLAIWGADGTVLISDHADAAYWSGAVPSTQDYNIQIDALNNTAPSYTMDVTIPPLEPTPPAPGCVNRSAFVADITVPDGTPWQPNQGFNKIWRVQNIGTCVWNTHYQLVFLDGEPMARVTQLAVARNVAPGQTLDLLIAMNAPAAFGVHSGRWQLRDDTGALFGTRLTIKITTINPTPPPQAIVISPANGFQFAVGATMRLTYQGIGNTELSAVALYINGTQVAKQTSRTPAQILTGAFDWKPAAGHYTLTVVATDISGQQTTSPQVSGAIVQPSPQCDPSIDFRADNLTLNRGEHTIVRWDVDCVQAIYLDGQGVTGHEARDVQPSDTTTYVLRVVNKNGGADERRVTITVNNTPAPTAPATTPRH